MNIDKPKPSTTRLMSVKETACYLHTSIHSIYSLCKEPDFPCLRIGRKTFVDKQELDNTWIPSKLASKSKGV